MWPHADEAVGYYARAWRRRVVRVGALHELRAVVRELYRELGETRQRALLSRAEELISQIEAATVWHRGRPVRGRKEGMAGPGPAE